MQTISQELDIKNQDLEEALLILKSTQIKLISSEKMSALGNMIAGVAHEINNPASFLKGNIEPAENYIKDIFSGLELYRKHTNNMTLEIEEELEELDLDFIQEDLPKLIESMNVGIGRITDISKSLRIFSRTDQEQMIDFDIHESIDSTLLLLTHRIKANENRPKINIEKKYGDFQKIKGFPGQLNQVLMNILANAIDACEATNQDRSFSEIKLHPNGINIHTSITDRNSIQIQIQDNGCGMTWEHQTRIFEQGFTTKEIGKGTGLGMAIAHHIITEKHNGTITVASELGQGTMFTITLPVSG
ncbi:MAG: GHKL domain-containing protein [Spirulina sp. SIO3F2]|nr:GHKL domain-containing protein [Spirulina sp. SIO3F2]